MAETGEPLVSNGPTLEELRGAALATMKELGDIIEPRTMVPSEGGSSIIGAVAEAFPKVDVVGMTQLARHIEDAALWALGRWVVEEEPAS